MIKFAACIRICKFKKSKNHEKKKIIYLLAIRLVVYLVSAVGCSANGQDVGRSGCKNPGSKTRTFF
jgi:hypothetical protein